MIAEQLQGGHGGGGAGRRPRIGIVASLDRTRPGLPANVLHLGYTAAIERAGGIPLILPFSADPAVRADMTAQLDGFVFPGGMDIDPVRYDEAPQAGLEEVDAELDGYQFAMLRAAFARRKPVLGICRGCQLINVALGGSLVQDIDSQWPTPPLPHRGRGRDSEHPVRIEPGSRLARLFGGEMLVNSRHHQAIREVGRDLLITATAPDGVVEAAEHSVLPIHLIQWHPERMLQKDGLMLPLFQEFVDSCRLDPVQDARNRRSADGSARPRTDG